MASVLLSDLNPDFLAPSQACTNPLFAPSPAAHTSPRGKAEDQMARKVTLELEDDGGPSPSEQLEPDLIRGQAMGNNAVKATVSLNDCLACNGCVTSAETVLIQEQSLDKFSQVRADCILIILTSRLNGRCDRRCHRAALMPVWFLFRLRRGQRSPHISVCQPWMPTRGSFHSSNSSAWTMSRIL